MKQIIRKSLLYQTGVEYGDYTINHAQGCSHGCLYPCYAMMMAKRFGKIHTYKDWIAPKIVSNAIELLDKEIPTLKDKIKFVHMCFSTDPFMYKYKEISDLTCKIIKKLNQSGIRCTALTKGLLPSSLSAFSKENEYGITLITINDRHRKVLEPFASPMNKRIKSLYDLHKKGIKTWVSIEPYPTPNIITQDFNEILKTIGFVDKIIFGRLNYNRKVSEYTNYKQYFNELSRQVIEYSIKNGIDYHIKDGTITNAINCSDKRLALV
jgi:DNA repair photolyase